jgi:ABC-type uncharacterized transport system ATPase subunit
VLLVSTDLDELAAIADRTAILSGGGLTPITLENVSSDDIGLALGGLSAGSTTGLSEIDR